MSVVIETTLGDITVDLYVKERPNTCLNFLKLCKVKYYNLCLFHKIERNFIAQTGDPTGTGRGGESVFCQLYGDQAKYFDSEFKPRLKHEKRGTVSMVNNGNNMNGSQFFITLGESLMYLDEVHTVFGEVAEGFDVLLKLNEAICNDNNRPYQDIRITHTVILHDPYEDPKSLEVPDLSPEPTKEQLESGYIAADEEIDDTKGKTAEEIEEKIKESEAKARATILEMVGDIPDVDVKPPENVLFVCKLNPVTTSEDLEIIFSRFGPIVSCEVIKDKKTDDSLQYAFIEFEKEQDCENAFFKMDNVLIDDRRIHVDFSQSVSKMYWDKGSKFQKSKTLNQNIVLKSSSKGTDGYELIFDDNLKKDVYEKKNRKHRSKSPKYRHDNFDKSTHRKKYRSRSPILEKEKKYVVKEYQDEQLHKSRRNHPLKDYKDEEHISHSRYKNRNYNEQFNESSKHSSRESKNYSVSEQSKRYLESYPKHKSSGSMHRHDFVSPNKDIQKSHDKRRQNLSSYDHSMRVKYLDKYDEFGDYKRDKKCKSSHKEAKKSKDMHSYDNRRYEKLSSKSQKKKMCRSPSVSSSSSSSPSRAKKKQQKKYATSSSASDSSSDSAAGDKSKRNHHSKKVFSNTSVASKKYKS